MSHRAMGTPVTPGTLPHLPTWEWGGFASKNHGKSQMALSSNERSARYRKKHPERSRESVRDSLRRRRASEREAKREVITWPDPPADPAGAAADWMRDNLIVPPGHPAQGSRFELPPYLAAFFADALAVDTHEAALIIARKNAKSAGYAALLLAFMAGPLRRAGWRCGVASLSREKAGELRTQVEAIALASGLEGVEFWKRGAPSITTEGGSIDILSATKTQARRAPTTWRLLTKLVCWAKRIGR